MKKIMLSLLLALSVTACCPAFALQSSGADIYPGMPAGVAFDDVDLSAAPLKVTDNFAQVALLDTSQLSVDEAIEMLAGEAVAQKVETVTALADSSGIGGWVMQKVVGFLADYPALDIALSVLGALVILLGPLANWTGNPRYSAAAILLNKLAQLLTFGSAKNQPDVLSVKEMLTNKPSQWPVLISQKRELQYFS